MARSRSTRGRHGKKFFQAQALIQTWYYVSTMGWHRLHGWGNYICIAVLLSWDTWLSLSPHYLTNSQSHKQYNRL